MFQYGKNVFNGIMEEMQLFIFSLYDIYILTKNV